MPFLELCKLEQIALGWLDKTDAIWSKLSRSDLPSKLLELLQKLLARGSQRVCPHGEFWLLVHCITDTHRLLDSMGLSHQFKHVTVHADLHMVWHVPLLIWRLSLSTLELVSLIRVQTIVPVNRLPAHIAKVSLPSDHGIDVLNNIGAVLGSEVILATQEVIPQE